MAESRYLFATPSGGLNGTSLCDRAFDSRRREPVSGSACFTPGRCMIKSDNFANIMIRPSQCGIRKMLLLTFAMLQVANAAADPAGLATASPPLTMARFYVVDSDGRSAADQNILTQTVSQDHRPSPPRRKKPDRRPRDVARKAGRRSDSQEPMLSRMNAAMAWQCERHGFFFTADGRCVRPVIHVQQARPPTTIRPPIRTKLSPR